MSDAVAVYTSLQGNIPLIAMMVPCGVHTTLSGIIVTYMVAMTPS